MERTPRGIEIDCSLRLSQMQADPQRRVIQVDGGSLTMSLAQLVDNSVFGPLGRIQRMGMYFAADHWIDGQRIARGEVLAPVELLHRAIEIIVGRCRKRMNRLEHTRGSAAP